MALKEKENERALAIQMQSINLKRDQAVKAAKSQQRAEIEAKRWRVKLIATLTPAILLLLIAVTVFGSCASAARPRTSPPRAVALPLETRARKDHSMP